MAVSARKSKAKRTRHPRLEPIGDLKTFHERYDAILIAARDFIARVQAAAERSGESPYTPTRLVAEHVSNQYPAAYIKTFGSEDPRELKVWRVTSILRNAGFLGAYDALGIESIHGKGLALAGTKSGKRPRLRLVK